MPGVNGGKLGRIIPSHVNQRCKLMMLSKRLYVLVWMLSKDQNILYLWAKETGEATLLILLMLINLKFEIGSRVSTISGLAGTVMASTNDRYKVLLDRDRDHYHGDMVSNGQKLAWARGYFGEDELCALKDE